MSTHNSPSIESIYIYIRTNYPHLYLYEVGSAILYVFVSTRLLERLLTMKGKGDGDVMNRS